MAFSFDPYSRSSQPTRAILKVVDGGAKDDFIFPMNPNEISREDMPQYVDINIAESDSSPKFGDDIPYFSQWVRNKPGDLHLGFRLYARGDNDVEKDLACLDRLMQKDGRLGHPPDLIYRYGKRADIVRITAKMVKEILHTADGRVQQADVKLTLKILRPVRM